MTAEVGPKSRKRASNPNRGSKPGERRGGRQKGTPNKTTALLKDAILLAADMAGEENGMVGYLYEQAKNNPSSFLPLLGKVLPLQVTGADGAPIETKATLDLSGAPEEVLRYLAGRAIDNDQR